MTLTETNEYFRKLRERNMSLTLNEKMTALKSLDDSCHIEFSTVTGMWYVSGRWEIKDGFVLTTPTDHQPLPETAVHTIFKELTTTPHPIIINAGNENRKAYRWTGFMWQEIKT